MTASKLFSPFTLGPLQLPNRIAMAPMTRCRATNPAIAPTPMMVEYYGLRADAGLIVSEGIPVSPQARGYAYTPGLYSAEQVAGWQAVTNEVHKQGGRIFAQLWHCGRISHGSLREDNAPPVGPSTIAANGKSLALDRATGAPALTQCEAPRALSTAEVKGVIARVRAGGEERHRRRLRRRRDPRRQRLPARPVPLPLSERPPGRVRRLAGEPLPPAPRHRARGGRRHRSGTHRHPPVAASARPTTCGPTPSRWRPTATSPANCRSSASSICTSTTSRRAGSTIPTTRCCGCSAGNSPMR